MMSDEAARLALDDVLNVRKRVETRTKALRTLVDACQRDRALFARLAADVRVATRPIEFAAQEDLSDAERHVRSFFLDVDDLVSAVTDGPSSVFAAVAPASALHARLSPERAARLEAALRARVGDETAARGASQRCGHIAQTWHVDVVAAMVRGGDLTLAAARALFVPVLIASGARVDAHESAPFTQTSSLLREPIAALMWPVVVDGNRSDDDRSAAWRAIVYGGFGYNVDVAAAFAFAVSDDAGPLALRRAVALWLNENAPQHMVALQTRNLVDTVDVPENVWGPVRDAPASIAASLTGGPDALARHVRVADLIEVLASPPSPPHTVEARRLDAAVLLAAALLTRVPSLLPMMLSPLVRCAVADDTRHSHGAVLAIEAALRQPGVVVDDALFAALLEAARDLFVVGGGAGLTVALARLPHPRDASARATALLRSTLSSTTMTHLQHVWSAFVGIASASQRPIADEDSAALIDRARSCDDVHARRALISYLLLSDVPRATRLFSVDASLAPSVEEVFCYAHQDDRGQLHGLMASPKLTAGLAATFGDDDDAFVAAMRQEHLGRALAVVAAAGARAAQRPAARPAIAAALLTALRRPGVHHGVVEGREPERFSGVVAIDSLLAVAQTPGAADDGIATLEDVVLDSDVDAGARARALDVLLRLSRTLESHRRGAAALLALAPTLSTAPTAFVDQLLTWLPLWVGGRLAEVEPLLAAWPALLARNDASPWNRAGSVAQVRSNAGAEAAPYIAAALEALRAAAVDEPLLQSSIARSGL